MLAFDKETERRIFHVADARAQGEPPRDGEDELIAEIMDLHPEFDDLWPQGDVALIAQPVNGQIVHPFVHVVLHGIIASQLRNEQPEFVKETQQRLMSSGLDEHESLHTIMSIYGDLYFRGVRQEGEFDEWEYSTRLSQIIVEDIGQPEISDE
ncbi:MAG: DUF1841 family protein [Nitrospirota bacterium]|jgi:hypothetical protein